MITDNECAFLPTLGDLKEGLAQWKRVCGLAHDVEDEAKGKGGTGDGVA
jgi:hypothetical protein